MAQSDRGRRTCPAARAGEPSLFPPPNSAASEADLSKDYSGTPLARKLGAKPGVGVVVFFTTSRADLEIRFAALKETLDPADGLWIAWPKKASKIDTDLSFDVVQELGLAHRLVDNKSCAIDESWQALRFVYRLKDR